MAAQNTGFQSYFILNQVFLDSGTPTGFKKPNLASNSPQALVPSGATITYNYPADVAPSGGANGDIWYNPVADQLFKKITGSWTELTDRVDDDDYMPPVTNTLECPLPTPPATPKHMLLYAQYGMTIVKLLNSNTTGIPAAAGASGDINLAPGNTMMFAYTTITSGNAQIILSGTPVIPGHVRLYLKVDGIVIFTVNVTGSGTYTLVFNDDVINPSSIEIGLETFS